MAAIAYPMTHDHGCGATHLEPYLGFEEERQCPLPASVYWCRRLAALLAVTAVLWLAATAIGGVATALSGSGGRPLTTPGSAGAGQAVVHVVQPGETFWSIARRLQPTGDIRPLVDKLAAAHGPGLLQAGDRIALR
jgi:hypothetical protein